MRGGRRGGRKLVAVPEYLVEELASIARSSGLTLPELVSLVLSYAVKVLRGRDSVRGLFSDAVILGDLVRLGAVPVPQRSLARVLEALGERERERLVEDVAGLAATAATAARLRGVYDGSPGAVLQLFLPEASVDEILEDGGGRLVVTMRGPPGGGMVALAERVAVAVLEGLGYRVEGVEVHGGGSVIVVRFARAPGGSGSAEA